MNISRARRGNSKLSRGRKSRIDSNAVQDSEQHVGKIIVDGEDFTPKALGFTFEDFQNQEQKVSTKPSEEKECKEEVDVEIKKTTSRPKTSSKKKGMNPKKSSTSRSVDETSVEICLQETKTMTLFLQSSVCVHKESAIHDEIEKRNEAYDSVLKRKRAEPGIFITNDAQTYNRPLKDKSTSTVPKATSESGCTATSWDIYDSMTDKKNAKVDILDGLGMGRNEDDNASTETDQVVLKAVDSVTRVLYATTGCLLSTTESKNKTAMKIGQVDGESVLKRQRHKQILESKSLVSSLNLVERLIQQNVYHDRHLEYRGMPAIESMSDALRRNMMSPPCLPEPSTTTTTNSKNEGSEEKKEESTISSLDDSSKQQQEEKTEEEQKEKAVMKEEKEEEDTTTKTTMTSEDEKIESKLKLFWKFECEETSSREVICECWNPRNKDLLAVGYGACRSDESKEKKNGLVCFWTLKNPEFPARVLSFDEEVTTISFSKKRPYLLAVGLSNGSVLVFDIRSETDSALLECSTGSPFKHSQAVWQIQWIDKGMEKGGEVLVTISSDGKVKEFNFKQGLQSTNLMTLKRIPRSREENFRWKPLNSKGEGIVSGEESGMCFDFALDNPHIYFCGTSDGFVHSCSCSYNEQYLNTFEGHQASVRQ